MSHGALEQLDELALNNALGTLVVCLNATVADGPLALNPALRVQRLPPAHIERDYLRLHEIPRYLDACSAVYRPLAELLIGSCCGSPRRWRANALTTGRTAQIELSDPVALEG